MPALVDLHLHTTKSDGLWRPTEVVRFCKKTGFSAISVTDHDTVAGVEEAMEAGEDCDVEVIPGIEISSFFEGKEFHILGYFIDYEDKRFRARLKRLKEKRKERAAKIMEKLNNLGFSLSMRAIRKNVHGDCIGRAHVADALVAAGCVKSRDEAFNLYLNIDGPAFVEKEELSSEEALDMIRKVGGVGVIAHPGMFYEEDKLRKLISLGIDGIETIHPRHDKKIVAKLRRTVSKYGLLETGGSDFHGDEKGQDFMRTLRIPYKVVLDIKSKTGKSRGMNEGIGF